MPPPPGMAEGAAAPSRLRLAGLCFFLQLLTIILFAAFVRYGPESDPGLCSPQSNCSRRDPEPGSGYPREYAVPEGCSISWVLLDAPKRTLKGSRGHVGLPGVLCAPQGGPVAGRRAC